MPLWKWYQKDKRDECGTTADPRGIEQQATPAAIAVANNAAMRVMMYLWKSFQRKAIVGHDPR